MYIEVDLLYIGVNWLADKFFHLNKFSKTRFRIKILLNIHCLIASVTLLHPFYSITIYIVYIHSFFYILIELYSWSNINNRWNNHSIYIHKLLFPSNVDIFPFFCIYFSIYILPTPFLPIFICISFDRSNFLSVCLCIC